MVLQSFYFPANGLTQMTNELLVCLLAIVMAGWLAYRGLRTPAFHKALHQHLPRRPQTF
jgi:hypothetical protein